MSPWTLRDLVDLEYLYRQDEGMPVGISQESLLKRDRGIAVREGILHHASTGEQIRLWLEARRRSEEVASGGEIVDKSLGWFSTCLKWGGAAAGVATATSLLKYAGTAPINVSWYVLVMMFCQMGWVALSFVFMGWRNLKSHPPGGGLPGAIWKKTAHHLSAHPIPFLEQVWKHPSSRIRRLLGGAIFWRVQWFGVCFNLGALAATLLLVFTSDLAFGWQTTLQHGPEGMHALVQRLATPWRNWVPDGTAHPTLQEIAGSRIILKDGIQTLASRDLASWWPFLCWGVLFYGLLPRLALLAAAAGIHGYRMKNPSFEDAVSQNLLLRMSTPMIESSSILPEGPGMYSPPPPTITTGAGTHEILHPAFWLVDPDLLTPDLAHRLEIPARVSASLSVQGVAPFVRESGNPGEPDATLHRHPVERLAVLMDARQPPILEHRELLAHLRELLGDQVPFHIVLTARDMPGERFPPVAAQDFKIWKQAIGEWGDPGTGLLAPGGVHE